jgi:PHD/YefM family antitoxin component YafN of YafNO toxin-antitoxin module
MYYLKIKGEYYMPAVTKSMDFANNLNEILEYCQNYKEPVFVSNNGQGRFAVMSEETYEELVGKSRIELYQALQMGLDQINNGEFIEEEEMMEKLNNYIRK